MEIDLPPHEIIQGISPIESPSRSVESRGLSQAEYPTADGIVSPAGSSGQQLQRDAGRQVVGAPAAIG